MDTGPSWTLPPSSQHLDMECAIQISLATGPRYLGQMLWGRSHRMASMVLPAWHQLLTNSVPPQASIRPRLQALLSHTQLYTEKLQAKQSMQPL